MFQVGQKVVCINDKMRPNEVNYPDLGFYALKKGNVYTIRGIFFNVREWVVYLEEIIRPLWYDGRELPYAMERFRPIQERKTDISIFTAMLNTKLVPQDEQV